MKPELSDKDGAVLPEEPLSRHTTLKVGGPARWYCRVKTEQGLSTVLRAASESGDPLALLGMGSNVVAADGGFPGWVVRLEGDFLRIEIAGERLTAGGGTVIIFVGILANLEIYFRQTTLFNVILMLTMFAAGLGLMARAVKSS